jgi:ABC-type spermidine/putrescine transport system permease subunit II
VTSFDELVASLFLTGPRLTTLPVQIYTYLASTPPTRKSRRSP